ncbi:MAG: PASTA domain-containing protein [candidate division Zixibacteria bacterium]|nr:PASTA domain-containing protein [candidate division Zixibacteria bacterium]
MSPPIPRPQRLRRETGFKGGASGWRRLLDYMPENPPGRLLVYAAIGLAAGMTLFVMFDHLVMPLVIRQGSAFELPNIVGMERSEAEEVLEKLGLKLNVTSEEYNPSFRDGAVLSQYPLSGTRVKSGRGIKVVTSLGEKDIIIPQITGVSVRQAKLDLETVGLRIGEISWTYTDTLPEKLVVFAFPGPGDTVSIGSRVNVLVNRGRGRGVTFMPNLIGLSLDEARDMLIKKGLKVGLVMTRRDENYLPETVLEQSEAEATELEVGEEVDLVVSTTD